MRPLFQLDPRLALCASFVPEGARLADIGTDHGYLPIWLAKAGRIAHAVAADLRPGPLERARENVGKYRVGHVVELRLSDGLMAIGSHEADFIVIAGMGGEVIASILAGAPWLRETKARLALQPMTSAEDLRRYLAGHGFEIIEERPVLSQGRPYSVLLAAFTGKTEKEGILFPYLGKLPETPFSGPAEREAALAYYEKQRRHLCNLEPGARAKKDFSAQAEFQKALKALEKLMREEFQNAHDSRNLPVHE